MATPAVCFSWTPQQPPWPVDNLLKMGVSTKGLHCDDSFARLIGPEFVDLVDPRKLIMFLPTHLLTPADEDRVVARQDSMGRAEGAKLLLALLCRRGDWIPGLQEGLRHREIRLEALADTMDTLQREVRMEIDFPEDSANDMLMEVDSEPWSDSQSPPGGAPLPPGPQALPPLPHPPPPAQGPSVLGGPSPGGPSASPSAGASPALPPPRPPLQAGSPHQRPQTMGSGRAAGEPASGSLHQGQGQGQGHRPDRQAVLAEIAQHFFLRLASSPQDVKILTDQFERIAAVLTTGYAVGCLEMRLRPATSRDLGHLRRLVESGVLQATVESALLSKGRRDWLTKEAAVYGLSWRQMKLKVTVAKDDLDRCERFLKVREEIPNPRNAAEALLQKSLAEMSTEGRTQRLPDLLVEFLEQLLQQHPRLAATVASELARRPLHVGIALTMALCRRHFRLFETHQKDLGSVALGMLDSHVTGEEAAPAEPPLKSQAGLHVVVPPGSPLADVVHRLTQVYLMMPCETPNVAHAFRFVRDFVADFALACVTGVEEVLPDDFVSKVLQAGSPFAVLHLVDLCLEREYTDPEIKAVGRFGRIHPKYSTWYQVAYQLLHSMSDPRQPQAVSEMYFAYLPFSAQPDCTPVLQRCWWTFGPAWKVALWEIYSFRGKRPDILLCHLSEEEMSGVRDAGAKILSAKHTVDLSDQLTGLSKPQLRVILACAQMSDVASFSLVKVGDVAALRVEVKEVGKGRKLSKSAGFHALKLCKNRLEDQHMECLLDALPGMETVSLFDLSFCTVSRGNLQRLLNRLCMTSVKTLVLNGIKFSDSQLPTLPTFSQLKRLRSVELSCLGLQDSHMPELAQQISKLADLRELTLEENPITTDGLSLLSPALASCASLRALRLRGCQLDAGGAFVLGAMLTSATSLHVLNLSRCALLDSGLQHLSFMLRNHTQLSKVSLREGGYSPAGLASFFSYIRQCRQMQHLELGQCPVEGEGVDVSGQFLRALAGSCYWDFLGLWQCRIGHTTFLQDVRTLPNQLRGLTSLVLQDNDINDTHVGQLADAVRRGVFRHLRHLNLRQNNIGETGATRLAEVLKCLPHMSELLMQHTAVTVDGALSLARAVLRLPHMTLLDLSDSFGIGRFDATDAVNKIERLVQDEDIAVGSGVGYADDDSALEEPFITDSLRLLNIEDTKPGEEHKEQQKGKRSPPLPPRPSTSGRARTSQKRTQKEFYEIADYEIYEEVYDDAPSVELFSPKSEDSTRREQAARRREITGRDRDTLFFDDVLCISLRHQ